VNYDTLVHSIGQFGYAALFFALWLGIIGMPIPDEVIVMTGGAVSKAGLLHPVPAFLVTYLGVVTGLSLGYLFGRLFGSNMLDKLRRKKNVEKHIRTSEQLLNKYGNFALVISYFIPVVRHIVPYLVGINKMSYPRYILYSFSAALAWSSVFFVLGQLAGNHVEKIGTMVYRYGLYTGLVLLLGVLLFITFKRWKSSRMQ